jgi:hypothetical protein
VWWGEDYLRVLPLYWSRGKDWTLLPLAWHRQGGSTGIGPVWWSGDNAGVFPLYWQNENSWTLLPLAGHNPGGIDWAGPFWRNKNSGRGGVFPLYWKSSRGQTLFPLAWAYKGGSKGIGPVWWNNQKCGGVFPLYWQDGKEWTLFPLLWKRDDAFTAFPLYWQRQKAGHTDRILFPLAWDTAKSTGVGPVWQSGDKFRVFPFYWQNGSDWLLAPLAWRDSNHHGVLPLYWNWRGTDKASRSIIPPLLAYSESTGDNHSTHALLGMVNYKADQAGTTFEFQPFIKTRSGKVSHFSIFWRLFEYHKNESESFYRMLFLPHKFAREESIKQ